MGMSTPRTAAVERHLLGYDVRLAAKTYVAQRWDATARRVFLLRGDIAWPLSVDSMVWPSIFQYEGANVAARALPLSGWIDVEPVDFPHRVLDLWQGPDAMLAAFNAAAPNSAIAGEAVAVAIEVVTEPGQFQGSTWAPLFEPGRAAATPPPGWTLLGYDVADESMTSGLSNCGYSESEKPDAAKRFGADLNDAGLFDSLDVARAFRAESDSRVPEHSPFHVYALSRRPEAL